MPSTRASSIPPTGTPLRTPALDRLAPSSSRSTRSTRSASQTPVAKTDSSAHPHHHATADEIMLQEAEKILSTPTRRQLRSDGPATPSTPGSSARDRRHAKILEARKKEESGSQASGSRGSREGTAITDPRASTPGSELGSVIPSTIAEEDSTPRKTDERGPGADDNRQAGEDDSVGDVIVVQDLPSSAADGQSDDGTEDEGESSKQSDSSVNLESSDSEDSDEDSDTSASDDDSDEEEERLEKLFQAAKINALAKTQKSKDSDKGADGEVVLQFDAQEKKEAPIPDLDIPALPPAHISFGQDGSAKASSSSSVLPTGNKKHSKGKERAPELELDNRPYERELSKREKAAQPKKATVSDLWATIPSARRDALPQMKRDYQALALANSLDPKRFMKGGAKATKVPESFAIGTMVEQPRHLQDTTLARDTRYKPGQIVQSLAKDEDMNTTAKRKYGDLQWKRMENGRGKGWKKRSQW